MALVRSKIRTNLLFWYLAERSYTEGGREGGREREMGEKKGQDEEEYE